MDPLPKPLCCTRILAIVMQPLPGQERMWRSVVGEAGQTSIQATALSLESGAGEGHSVQAWALY